MKYQQGKNKNIQSGYYLRAMTNKPSNTEFYSQVVDLLQSVRNKVVVRTVNHTMVLTYFEIGKKVVEEEQNEKERAGYGKQLLGGFATPLQ